MPNSKESHTDESLKERRIATVSAVLVDDTLVEMALAPKSHRTSFLLAKHGEWHSADSVPIDASVQLVPYSARNNLLAHEVVLLRRHPRSTAPKRHFFRRSNLSFTATWT
jgi:hypothetical protein